MQDFMRLHSNSNVCKISWDRYFSKSKEFSGEIVGVWKMKIKWKFKQDMIMLFSFKDLSDSDDMMLGTWYMPE